jgi:hypothetical protein
MRTCHLHKGYSCCSSRENRTTFHNVRGKRWSATVNKSVCSIYVHNIQSVSSFNSLLAAHETLLNAADIFSAQKSRGQKFKDVPVRSLFLCSKCRLDAAAKRQECHANRIATGKMPEMPIGILLLFKG